MVTEQFSSVYLGRTLGSPTRRPSEYELELTGILKYLTCKHHQYVSGIEFILFNRADWTNSPERRSVSTSRNKIDS